MLKKVLLFCFVLSLSSLAFGQEFNLVENSSDLYPSLTSVDYIPESSDLAILKYTVRPNSSVSNSTEVLSVSIIPRLSSGAGIISNPFGFVQQFPANDERVYYSIISSSDLYLRGTSGVLNFNNFLSQQIQQLLTAQNLGTVKQRAAFIRGFHSGPVQILDIDNFKKSILNALSPFLNIYLGIFLTLFVVDLMSKKSKDVIAESAKIQRRAERAQQRREMRADPTAQIFEFRLANFSSIASGSVSDPSISRRKARRLFEDTAMEYAQYKKSRGWKY